MRIDVSQNARELGIKAVNCAADLIREAIAASGLLRSEQ
jgi:hypothetical protein